ncbi:hypothetical protein [Tenacibaculum sp. IB213877]|uniref:hypothetical protein n=1 Tax=Tenacibaculum sp. IB213877 TaxID=3097351 RepID=UPI002A59D349|nr:hypothetical protein [Tenacibaculum sp. IB213877]MDY0780087.1 hypothetical protein [Tenacibaculum sp. IB213877]
MKKITVLLLFISTTFFAQKKNINNYKYIIVPKQFEFVKEADKYQTSSLTKFLFNKYGFTAFMSDEVLPDDLAVNRCLALTADVNDKSSMFTTKTVIELKDCYNNVVFTSKEGNSKVKEYKKAYHEAIREAFNSVRALGYKYVPSKPVTPVTVKKTEGNPSEAPKAVLPTSVEKVTNVASTSNVLYAQPMANGFQLINTKPEVVFLILKTSNPNLFILKDKNGVFYKQGNIWIAEYYKEGNNKTESYQVKF